jgi:hypothetical protein
MSSKNRKLTSRAMAFGLCLGLVVLTNIGVESIATASSSRQSTLTLTVPPRPRGTLTLTVPPRPRGTLTLTVPPRP